MTDIELNAALARQVMNWDNRGGLWCETKPHPTTGITHGRRAQSDWNPATHQPDAELAASYIACYLGWTITCQNPNFMCVYVATVHWSEHNSVNALAKATLLAAEQKYN